MAKSFVLMEVPSCFVIEFRLLNFLGAIFRGVCLSSCGGTMERLESASGTILTIQVIEFKSLCGARSPAKSQFWARPCVYTFRQAWDVTHGRTHCLQEGRSLRPL